MNKTKPDSTGWWKEVLVILGVLIFILWVLYFVLSQPKTKQVVELTPIQVYTNANITFMQNIGILSQEKKELVMQKNNLDKQINDHDTMISQYDQKISDNSAKIDELTTNSN